MLLRMPAVHVYQILNFYTKRAELDAGFQVLDNSDNQRPDWYEYWPIRNFLTGQPLDEEAFYGFLSPKFHLKTNLSAQTVRDLLAAVAPDVDVALFSPSIHNAAYFWNVFEHGESEHPGLLAVSQRFFARAGHPQQLKALVSDSRNTVHSNYFIARPRFWRAWLTLTEQLYAIAESAGDDLGAALRAPTEYRGARAVSMKIFVMERVASFLLMTDPTLKAVVRDPFAARTRVYKVPLAVVCDALKIAHTLTGRGQYRVVFHWVSALARSWNLRIRAAALAGGATRRCLEALKSYWAAP